MELRSEEEGDEQKREVSRAGQVKRGDTGTKGTDSFGVAVQTFCCDRRP